jgi:hypothetical protein
MRINNDSNAVVKYPGDSLKAGLKVSNSPQQPLMTCAALRKAAGEVKNLFSLDEKKVRVRQLHDEILRYGDYTEPELHPSILLDLWGIWVKDMMANPNADIFVSCLEALAYAEFGASIPGHGWDQWLQNSHNLTKVVDRIFQSKYTDERSDMIGALIPIVNLDGLAILIDAIERFNDRDDYAGLFGKVNVALDILKKSDADDGKWPELKRRINDFVNTATFHSEIDIIINEGRQLSTIRPQSGINEGNAPTNPSREWEHNHTISNQAAFHHRRNEIEGSHYWHRLENYRIAIERTLASAKSAPVEQAAAALARLCRSLSPNDPHFGVKGTQNLDQYVRDHLPSIQPRFAELTRN